MWKYDGDKCVGTTCKYLYHLTDTPNLQELKPSIGKNSKLIGEKEPRLYLCEHKDIEYWQCILNCKYLIRIDANAVNFDLAEVFEYDCYSEVIYKGAISQTVFNYIKVPAVSEKVMKELAESYILGMNLFCRAVANYNDFKKSGANTDEINDFKREILSFGKMLQVIDGKIDFSVLSAAKKKSIIVHAGNEGECTLADTWNGTEKRLWEKLVEYKGFSKDLSGMCKWVNAFIVKNLPKSARYANTGGWIEWYV